MRVVLIIFILGILISSCGKKCICEPEQVIPAFVSYNQSEVDTILVKRFQKNTNFTEAYDEFLLHSGNAVISVVGDTTFFIPQQFVYRLQQRWDLQLVNPFDGRTVNISDIEIEQKETTCGGIGIFSMDPQPCISPITGFKKDGVAVTFDPMGNFRKIIFNK
jgi:hypothetical protein